MGHGHSHGHSDVLSHGHSHGRRRAGRDEEFQVDPVPRTVLLVVLGAVLVATVAGLVWLWPDADRTADLRGSVGYAAEGVTFPRAVVDGVEPACPAGQEPVGEGCGRLHVTVAEGADDGRSVAVGLPAPFAEAGLRAGDDVQLIRTPGTGGGAAQLNFYEIQRDRPLLLLVVVFVVVVLAVARLRGLLALLGLAFAGVVAGAFMFPGLLSGEPAVLVAVVGSTAIMYVVLYTTHGFSVRTSAALAGTLGGLVITAAVGRWAVGANRLGGMSDEVTGVLATHAPALDFQGLLLAAIVIAGLGVLNDVTITQASAVWELRAAAPAMTRARIFASAMRIGRDHIASTIYTILFAYAGAALTLLLVIQLYDRPLLELAGTSEIATEIVRSMASSIGLVLAVPITTAIAALTVPGARPEAVSVES